MFDDIDHIILCARIAKGALTGSEVRLKLAKEDYNIRIFLHAAHPCLLPPPQYGAPVAHHFAQGSF